MKSKSKRQLQKEIEDKEKLLQKKQLTNPLFISKEVENCIDQGIVLTVMELSRKLNVSPQRIMSTFSAEKRLNSKLSKAEILFILTRFKSNRLSDIETQPQKKILNKLLREKKKIINKVISTPMQN